MGRARGVACPFARCSKVLSCKSALKRHIASHLGHYKHYCEECRKGYQSKADYDQHVAAKHEGRSWPCELCNKHYFAKKNLQAHQAEHTGNYPYTCSYCQKGFLQKCAWKEHENQHAGVKFSCRKCGKDFFLESRKYSHEKSCNKLSALTIRPFSLTPPAP